MKFCQVLPLIVREISGRTILVNVNSYKGLISMCCNILKYDQSLAIRVVMEDGTEVDDDEVLMTLEPYTRITLLKPGEDTQFYPSRLTELLGQMQAILSHQNRSVVGALEKALNADAVRKFLESATRGEGKEQEEKGLCGCDLRSEHPAWFDGLPKKVTSKRTVMRDSAKRRIRGYFYKSKDDMITSVGRSATTFIFDQFDAELKKHDSNGGYFVRGDAHALCDVTGDFWCAGAFDREKCAQGHVTNPYESRDSYVLFGTWNLDHCVERSRSILPALTEAIKSAKGRQVNVAYFYTLLFTTSNLKLVHLVCHKKTKHVGRDCDQKMWFLDAKISVKRLSSEKSRGKL